MSPRTPKFTEEDIASVREAFITSPLSVRRFASKTEELLGFSVGETQLNAWIRERGWARGRVLHQAALKVASGDRMGLLEDVLFQELAEPVIAGDLDKLPEARDLAAIANALLKIPGFQDKQGTADQEFITRDEANVLALRLLEERVGGD